MKATTLKNFQRVFRLPLPLLFLFLAAAIPAAGQQGRKMPEAAEPTAKDQFPPLIHSIEGPELFQSYCASCHGPSAKGNGPVAAVLRAKAPDLTVLSRGNHGDFPVQRVRQVIMGDIPAAAHGSREMPVWGPIFHQVEADEDWGNVRLSNLVEYLQSIQSSEPSNVSAASSVPSGASLYRQHCASCHGNDLKGGVGAPPPFKTPPDLTTLSRRRGGKFPEAFVADVLRNGVTMPEHGPADMPIWGADFALAQTARPQVELRIANLTGYLKSKQLK